MCLGQVRVLVSNVADVLASNASILEIDNGQIKMHTYESRVRIDTKTGEWLAVGMCSCSREVLAGSHAGLMWEYV